MKHEDLEGPAKFNFEILKNLQSFNDGFLMPEIHAIFVVGNDVWELSYDDSKGLFVKTKSSYPPVEIYDLDVFVKTAEFVSWRYCPSQKDIHFNGVDFDEIHNEFEEWVDGMKVQMAQLKNTFEWVLAEDAGKDAE